MNIQISKYSSHSRVWLRYERISKYICIKHDMDDTNIWNFKYWWHSARVHAFETNKYQTYKGDTNILKYSSHSDLRSQKCPATHGHCCL